MTRPTDVPPPTAQPPLSAAARSSARLGGTAVEPEPTPSGTVGAAGGARTGGLRLAGLVLALAAVLVVTILVSVTIGPADIAVADVLRSIGHHLGLAAEAPARLTDAIVWELRLPRVLTAAAVGAGLAVAGAVMQSLTRNPLADPYLLGLSSGASLGAVAVLLLGASIALPPAAFLGALAALVATMTLAGSLGALTPTRTVLAGLAVSQLCAAATSFVIFWSATGDSYREILGWLLGSLAGSTWASVAIAGTAVLVLGSALVGAGRTLDAFAFGDTAAAALGVHVPRTRWMLLTLVALLTGALVSVSGSIGFLGLVLPHAVRFVVGARHRLLLPVAALVGASFLVWADTAARTVFEPRELPVGILTAFLGAPVFAWLLFRSRAESAS